MPLERFLVTYIQESSTQHDACLVHQNDLAISIWPFRQNSEHQLHRMLSFKQVEDV